jgi:anoctamin-10
VTNATLIYLFRPATTLSAQTPNPNIPATGSVYLHRIVSEYDVSPTLQTILPTLVPLVAIALAASHGYIILHWLIEGLTERLLWRGSEEEIEVQKMGARGSGGAKEEMKQKIRDVKGRKYKDDEVRGGFWNGGQEGARAIGSVGKAE